MPRTQKAAKRTLLWSVIMSSPGPLVVGLSLFIANSSTQTADFIRRTSEFIAIVMSFIVYKIAENERFSDKIKKERLERISNLSVGALMTLGGTIMSVLALVAHSTDKGNVTPGLVIAILSASANTVFWQKYERLGKKRHNPILAVQARLYRAKTLIDSCVTVALITVIVLPDSQISHVLDIGGSVVVAVYLLNSGIRTVLESVKALKLLRQSRTEKAAE